MRTLAILCLTLTCLHAEESAPPGIKHLVAVKDVCAWPALTLLPDGSINATLFGQPSHGQVAGAIEVWNSPDGEAWTKRGVPAPNEPETNRMNHAAGLAKNGDLLVLCSGWTNVKQPQRPKQPDFRDDILSTWVCRSADGGKTWTQIKEFPAPDDGWSHYIPFGDIKRGGDGALHVSCYGGEFTDPSQSSKTKGYRSWHFRSDDDGATWQRTSVIHATGNETTVLHLGGKRWLAAARERAMDLFWSEDDGATWGDALRVTAIEALLRHWIREKVERGRRLLEPLFRGFVVRAHVRVQLFGEIPVRAPNFIRACGPAHAEGGVWIPAQGVSALRLREMTRAPVRKSESDACDHSGLPDYNVMVNSVFNPVAPLSPNCATRMCNDPGREPKSVVCAAAVYIKVGREIVSLRITSPPSSTSSL